MAESNLRNVGCAWRKTDKTGRTFYSGKLDAEALTSALAGGETRLLIFAVKNKRERGPDIEIFAAPDERPRPPAPVRESRVDDILESDDIF